MSIDGDTKKNVTECGPQPRFWGWSRTRPTILLGTDAHRHALAWFFNGSLRKPSTIVDSEARFTQSSIDPDQGRTISRLQGIVEGGELPRGGHGELNDSNNESRSLMLAITLPTRSLLHVAVLPTRERRWHACLLQRSRRAVAAAKDDVRRVCVQSWRGRMATCVCAPSVYAV